MLEQIGERIGNGKCEERFDGGTPRSWDDHQAHDQGDENVENSTIIKRCAQPNHDAGPGFWALVDQSEQARVVYLHSGIEYPVSGGGLV